MAKKNRNAALLECPRFLLELVAAELKVPLCTLENQIKSNDHATIESIESVILEFGERVKSLQKERLTSGGAS